LLNQPSYAHGDNSGFPAARSSKDHSRAIAVQGSLALCWIQVVDEIKAQ
jgi:hypothetical protein